VAVLAVIVDMLTLEDLGFLISFISLILIALTYKKLREVDLNVILLPCRQWMGFPNLVEVCFDNISDSSIPYIRAAIKIYVGANVIDEKIDEFYLKKRTKQYFEYDFVRILKSFKIVDDRNAVVSGSDLDNLRKNVRVFMHYEFSGYRLFGRPLFKKRYDLRQIWDESRVGWRYSRSNEQDKFT
jgi:hypothetical protein